MRMASIVAVVAGGPMVQGMSDAPEGCEIATASPQMENDRAGLDISALPVKKEPVVDDRRCSVVDEHGQRCKGWKNKGTEFCAGHNRNRKG